MVGLQGGEGAIAEETLGEFGLGNDGLLPVPAVEFREQLVGFAAVSSGELLAGQMPLVAQREDGAERRSEEAEAEEVVAKKPHRKRGWRLVGDWQAMRLPNFR